MSSSNSLSFLLNVVLPYFFLPLLYLPGPLLLFTSYQKKEVQSHSSTVAKERKDRIALASTSSDPYLLCTHLYSKDSNSSVEKDNKNKLRGQLKGMNYVKTIKSGIHANVYIIYQAPVFVSFSQVLFCQRSPTYTGMTLQDSPLPRRL